MSVPSLLTGQRFGHWTVLATAPERRGRSNHPYWQCRCDCGTVRPIDEYSLRNGGSKSCGCLRREVLESLEYNRSRSAQAWCCVCGGTYWCKLTKGFVAIVSSQDRELIQNHVWTAHVAGSTVYAMRWVVKDGKSVSVILHREILPDVPQVDHENWNGLDNRRENLRVG
jgi:hypothetical protein